MKLEYKRESYMPGEPTGDDHAILRPWLLNDGKPTDKFIIVIQTPDGECDEKLPTVYDSCHLQLNRGANASHFCHLRPFNPTRLSVPPEARSPSYMARTAAWKSALAHALFRKALCI